MIAGVDGRIAIVGGSSSGLGYAVAELLARSGAKVMVVSRSEERVAKAVKNIRSAGGASVEGCAADFTDEGAPAAVVAATSEHHHLFAKCPHRTTYQQFHHLP